MQIYINRDGQQFGPFTLDQVNQGLATGQLLPNDFALYAPPLSGLVFWALPASLAPVAAPGIDMDLF